MAHNLYENIVSDHMQYLFNLIKYAFFVMVITFFFTIFGYMKRVWELRKLRQTNEIYYITLLTNIFH